MEDYLVVVNPDRKQICGSDESVIGVEVPNSGALPDPDPVTLNLAGDPLPGTTVAIADNPVVPPATTELSITATGSLAPGHYELEIAA